MENIESKEEWKQIDDYDNYSVSTLGNVRNDETMRILKGRYDTHGYLKVALYKNCKISQYFIHRLVALAFIPNPENKPYVDHIFNNITDNRVQSLRWCTIQENTMNKQIASNNTSGCKGVFWAEHTQKWRAVITIKKIKIHLGYFDSKEDARDARKTRANQSFGVFTNLCETMDC